MARTESTMVPLGTVAPAFELRDAITGRALGRDDVFGMDQETRAADNVSSSIEAGPGQRRGLLVMFVCVHCPYVKHLEQELGQLGRQYYGESGKGPIAIAAIQSNDTEQYPEDGIDGMADQARRCGWTFPYLLDETQEVARSYGAACTPDFFLFDGSMQLVYRGQFDRSRPRRGDGGNDEPVTGADLRGAIESVLRGTPPDPEQRASLGCNIKWRENTGV